MMRVGALLGLLLLASDSGPTPTKTEKTTIRWDDEAYADDGVYACMRDPFNDGGYRCIGIQHLYEIVKRRRSGDEGETPERPTAVQEL